MKDRRELLKVLGVAGAAGAVWKKPVVDAVILPTHAATSCIPTCSPSPSSLTTTIDAGDDDCGTDIAIIFDGQNCSIISYDDSSGCPNSPGGPPDNAIFTFDGDDQSSDNGIEYFDIYGPGANWNVTKYNGINPSDSDSTGNDTRPKGTHTVEVTGDCGVYDLTFTVDLNSGSSDGSVDMTVKNVLITAVT